MKVGKLMILALLALLAHGEWQQWRGNLDDRITFADKGVPSVSLWQCGLLRQQMAELEERRMPASSMPQQEAESLQHYLVGKWQTLGCEFLLDQG